MPPSIDAGVRCVDDVITSFAFPRPANHVFVVRMERLVRVLYAPFLSRTVQYDSYSTQYDWVLSVFTFLSQREQITIKPNVKKIVLRKKLADILASIRSNVVLTTMHTSDDVVHMGGYGYGYARCQGTRQWGLRSVTSGGLDRTTQTGQCNANTPVVLCTVYCTSRTELCTVRVVLNCVLYESYSHTGI